MAEWPRDANQVGPVTGEMVVVGRPAMCVGGMTEEARASVLVRVEIEGGMRGGERVIVAGLLDSMRLVAVTDAIARRAGEHLRRYRRSHSGTSRCSAT